MMSSATSSPIQHDLHSDGDEQSPPTLEVQMRSYIRLISGDLNQIVLETAPIPLRNSLFPLPPNARNIDPVFLQIYIADILLSLNVGAVASEIISAQIASFTLQLAEEHNDTNVHVVAVVDNVMESRFWRLQAVPVEQGGSAAVERREVVEEVAAANGRYRMEKVEAEEEEEDLGNCSICLDEMKCEGSEVIRTPCGHVYHESCIFRWLDNSDSCPLCRTKFPLMED